MPRRRMEGYLGVRTGWKGLERVEILTYVEGFCIVGEAIEENVAIDLRLHQHQINE